jgi:DNA-binding MarR family transcriptional regulator
VEIFQSGNEQQSLGAKVSEEQINLVVHGFVQVWNKFEDAIAREVSASGHKYRNESRLNSNNDLLFRVGTALSSSPSLTMGELSNALSVPLSTATRVVSILVDEGHLQRFPDPDDRRVVRVSFTDGGSTLYKFIDGRISERVRMIASHLTEVELADLLRLLNKVAVAVKETLR